MKQINNVGGDLSDNQIKMLQMMFDVDPEFNYVFYRFFDELKLPMAVLKKEMAGLRKMGLVEFTKGLLDEEGMTAGAGNGISYEKRAMVKEILDKQKDSLVDEFNISEPIKDHHTLEVKGIKYSVSLKELEYLRDLLITYLNR